VDWFLYVVRTVDDCLYAGITTDVERRYNEHVTLGRKAARYFRIHSPEALAFSVPVGARSLALKVEYRFKQLSKLRKEKIISEKRLIFDESTGEINSE